MKVNARPADGLALAFSIIANLIVLAAIAGPLLLAPARSADRARLAEPLVYYHIAETGLLPHISAYEASAGAVRGAPADRDARDASKRNDFLSRVVPAR